MLDIYHKKRIIGWSDLDSNRHLANSSYVKFFNFVRFEFFKELNFSIEDQGKLNIGPAVLHEEYSFFREGMPGEEVTITAEITGLSDDGMIFSFDHNLYRQDGTHLCYCNLIAVWFDLETRKMIAPPATVLSAINNYLVGREIKKLSKDDFSKLPFKPNNIDPNLLK